MKTREECLVELSSLLEEYVQAIMRETGLSEIVAREAVAACARSVVLRHIYTAMH